MAHISANPGDETHVPGYVYMGIYRRSLIETFEL